MNKYHFTETRYISRVREETKPILYTDSYASVAVTRNNLNKTLTD